MKSIAENIKYYEDKIDNLQRDRAIFYKTPAWGSYMSKLSESEEALELWKQFDDDLENHTKEHTSIIGDITNKNYGKFNDFINEIRGRKDSE